jgi:Lar family restriction alleviation protein
MSKWIVRACPFCGEEFSRRVSRGVPPNLHWTECQNCGSRGPICPTEQAAFESWNQRRRTPKESR